MSPEKWSGILSALAGVSILVASFFQWSWPTYEGSKLKRWPKVMFAVLIVVELVAVGLLLAA